MDFDEKFNKLGLDKHHVKLDDLDNQLVDGESKFKDQTPEFPYGNVSLSKFAPRSMP